MAKELITLILIASSCSLVGTFLVIRGQAMLTDALSHSVLLGIVLSYLVVRDITSPYLIVGAGLLGIFVAFLIESIQKVRYIKKDVAIGIIFPLMFSIGVILLSSVLKKAHICERTVIVGDIGNIVYHFIPGTNIPRIIISSLVILLLNIIFIGLFFKELKITSFDPELAKTLGISPLLIFYILIANTSLTTVVSFNAVGTVLVTGFMVAPPLVALLFTKDLKYTLILSVVVGILSAVIGFYIGDALNTNYSGTIATVQLTLFMIVILFEPRKGVVFNIFKRKILKEEYAIMAMMVHIKEHGCNNKKRIANALSWSENLVNKRIQKAVKKEYLKEDGENTFIFLEKGEEKLKEIS